MTTAHRPTWKAAVGKANEGGWTAGGAVSTQKSALDAPSQLSLKLRAQPVDKTQALQESLAALEQAETLAHSKKKAPPPRPPVDPLMEKQSQQRLLKQSATEVDVSKLKAKYNDSDVEDSSSSESDLDDDDDDKDDSDDDSSDDEDDEAALQAELAKIRAERDEAQRQAQAKADEAEQAEQEEAALLGNPLLATAGGIGSTSGSNKRRWNDDVVFRHQAKGEPKPKKRFINDTVRNDFHKRFLNKFIR